MAGRVSCRISRPSAAPLKCRDCIGGDARSSRPSLRHRRWDYWKSAELTEMPVSRPNQTSAATNSDSAIMNKMATTSSTLTWVRAPRKAMMIRKAVAVPAPQLDEWPRPKAESVFRIAIFRRPGRRHGMRNLRLNEGRGTVQARARVGHGAK